MAMMRIRCSTCNQVFKDTKLSKVAKHCNRPHCGAKKMCAATQIDDVVDNVNTEETYTVECPEVLTVLVVDKDTYVGKWRE